MLDTKTKELVAIGASVVANCQPCLDYHAEEARKAGASDSEMRDAAGIARMVRKAGAEKMDTYAGERLGEPAPERTAPGACCGSAKREK
ncbi:MAG: carboxymuconolactone decarboxylase family protein [Candidatus Hydrogenedentes bacterium]|nr:carboxymuconolactone decarboxylase family protein [Candidatus Hydrogenedentota bacterium]